MICLCCIMSCFEIFLSQDGVFQRFTGFTKNKKTLCQQWWRLLVKNSIISQFPETSSVLTFWLISGFKKIASLRPVTLLKKGLWHRCFPVDFAKLLRTPFLQNSSSGCFGVLTVLANRLIYTGEVTGLHSNSQLLIKIV